LFSLPVKRMYLIEGAAPEQGLIFEWEFSYKKDLDESKRNN
jgi:hypothetical protein